MSGGYLDKPLSSVDNIAEVVAAVEILPAAFIRIEKDAQFYLNAFAFGLDNHYFPPK
jgi:hypothetical protein